MSERLTDAELERLRAVVPGCHVCGAVSVYIRDIQSMAVELVTRRAADTKPAPIEQGTLRDGIAMDALREMWRHPAPGVGLSIAGLHGRNHADDALAAYAIADAMLAQRAKETEKP